MKKTKRKPKKRDPQKFNVDFNKTVIPVGNWTFTNYPDYKRWDNTADDIGVMRRWTLSLSRRMQATLISGCVRGCDSMQMNIVKLFLAALRWDCMNPSKPGIKATESTKYMGYHRENLSDLSYMKAMAEQITHAPLHYVHHFMEAIKICSIYHPAEDRKQFWNSVLFAILNILDVLPERAQDMARRLEDYK